MFLNENAVVCLGPELGTKVKTMAEKLLDVFFIVSKRYELYKSLTSHIY